MDPMAATSRGLSTPEANLRLLRDGPNAIREEKTHPGIELLKRFWAPVPWLLEATVVIQLFLGEKVEAAVVGGLLVFNALLSFVQEKRTQHALVLLRQKLQVRARVCRDGAWTTIAAEQLVVGDWLHLRQGVIVPADTRIESGTLQLDQSALTGESIAVDGEPGKMAYAGAIVRAGEANGEVTATGGKTFFGKTAELVRTARSVNRQEHEIAAVVRNLFVVNAAMITIVLGYAETRGFSLGHMLPLILALLLATIPVALPATFTLTAAFGSAHLAGKGVLITRLSALHDIASMTVLCTDKTGTLTKNEASVEALRPLSGSSATELLCAAVLASDPAGQDLVDGAVLRAATERSLPRPNVVVTSYVPFDPAAKRSEGVSTVAGVTTRFTKGAPEVVAKLVGVPDELWMPTYQVLASQGQRVLAVACQRQERWQFLGLLGLADAVREDSREVVGAIHQAGVRVLMVTGDNAVTATAVAAQVGIGQRLCSVEKLRSDGDGSVVQGDIFAGVFPQDKFNLVRILQRHGAVVGMSGDGVNDAPALRQAEAGIAVANATDVAKAAAAIVLTRPGLSDVFPAIDESRRVFQRIIAYTLNMLTKKIELMCLLGFGFLLTGHKPLTPLMMVLILFLADFLTMALSTDRMKVSQRPNQWNTRAIALTAFALALGKLVFSFGILVYGHYVLCWDTAHLQTLMFVVVILSTQAGIYLIRERGHFWDSCPSPALLASSAFGVLAAIVLCQSGWLMARIDLQYFLAAGAVAAVYFAMLDFVKVQIFRWMKVR